MNGHELIFVGVFCLGLIGAVAVAIAAAARAFAPGRTSNWYWPCAFLGGLADLLVGFMVGLVAVLTFGRMAFFVNPGESVTKQFFLPFGCTVALWFAVTALTALGYRWLRKRWTTVSVRALATIGVCILLAFPMHFFGVEHGEASQGRPGELSPSHAWFGWMGEFHPTLGTICWFAPRFTSAPYGGPVSFVLGIAMPFMLSGGALLALFMAVKRGQPSRTPIGYG
jgi:hypothetical protein